MSGRSAKTFSAWLWASSRFVCACLALLLCAQLAQAQAWTEAYIRGTPNNWGSTAMTKNATTGLWETQQTFGGIANPRFKISHYGDNWNEAYPAADYVLAADGDYKITFNETTKAITATVVPPAVSVNTICYNNTGNFATPTIYFWNPTPAVIVTPAPAWPGKLMTKHGNYYCYDFANSLTGTSMPTSMGVIFSNNGATQSANLTYTGSGCYNNGTWKTLAQCGYTVNPVTSSSSSSVASSVASSVSSSAASSSSSSVAPAGTVIYFKNTANFATPYIHYWNVVPVITGTTWPGIAMKSLGNSWFSYTFPSAITSSGIIFSNNGATQTANLAYGGGLNCYNGTAWQTAVACGAPVMQANAGPNRKANQNTRQVFSAVASTGDYTSAAWTSPAWTGTLTGTQVVTPVLAQTGTFTVTLTLTNASGQTATATTSLTVVAATQGLPERPLLATPLKFPTTGSVSTGKYRFVKAFPNLDALFPSPVLTLADGVNDLMYVVDKMGVISAFPNKDTVTTSEVRTILNISTVVRNNHEMGLLSMAFDPQFATNGFIYVYYVYGLDDSVGLNGVPSGDTILERWTVNDPHNPTGVVANSRVEILRVPQIGPDHKGGMMQFHPSEGYLYIGIGDGGYGNSAFPLNPVASDPRTNNSAQDTTNLRGKFIRIKPLATPGMDGKYYQVPADNPYVGMSGYAPEIWSYGHRNPWRWAFDKQSPYTLWETEVGQHDFEEVNLIKKGKNYGWPVCEGLNNRADLGGNPTKMCNSDYEPPIDGEVNTEGKSIIGGFVYRGTTLPGLSGAFIFGDYVTKRIWSIVPGKAKTLVSDTFPENIASFGTDLSGNNVFVTSYGIEYAAQGARSAIYKLVDDNATAAVIPPKLSATGLFADLATLTPATGVIEYSVNTQGWFDGLKPRHFMSIPNDKTIGFDVTATWDMPVGTVLVKHLSVEASGNANKPFTTAVLFRQADGTWQAANYRWNAAGTDADLVTTATTEFDGGLVNRLHDIQTPSDCAACHVGSGSKNPLAMHTRELNGNFNYQGVTANQLTTFNSVNMFTTAINAASSYAKFAAPDDSTADLTLRARSYLSTNCSHCHASSFMDMRFDTPLANMRLLGVGALGSNQRVKPFDHNASLVYIYQTTDTSRMPRGTRYTNPLAATLFTNWIDALDAVQTGVALRSTQTQVDFGGTITMTLDNVFSNGFTVPNTGAISWSSTAPAVMSTSGKSGNNVVLAATDTGSATITATSGSFSSNLTITVAPPANSVASIDLMPAGPINLTSTQQLLAVGKLNNGNLANVYGQVKWRVVSGGAAVSVSPTGLLTRLATGTAVIEAEVQGVTKQITVNSLAPGLFLRYDNPNKWASVYIYTWTVVNGANVVPVAWPGVLLNDADGDGWWSYLVDAAKLNAGSVNVIFNNGGTGKTPDLLGITASSSYSNAMWTPWDGSSGTPTTGRLSVIGGTLPTSVRDFASGTIVTVTANAPLPNTTFGGWSGDALPYIFTDPNKSVVQMLIPKGVASLSLTALFNGDADIYKPGRNYYASQCVGCHGVNGTGFSSLNTLGASGRYTLASLASFIDQNMPKGNASACVGTSPGDCAYDIANMIMANAFIAPCTGDACNTANKAVDVRNMRLLTRQEYYNSVSDIFAPVAIPATVMSSVPADGLSRNFDTASFLTIDDDRNLGYQQAAKAIADQVITAKGFLGLVSGCADNTCAVQKLGLKLFRRPLTSAEVTKYVALYNATDAGRAVVQALMISPKFLYRSEMGTLDTATGLYRLNSYEIATLLSYTFWVTTPDDALLASAASGTLNIQTETTRLLNDPRAERGLRRFASGWLINSKYGFAAISSPTLVDAFKEETVRFVMEGIKADKPFTSMLTSNYTYANTELAAYYGLPAVPAGTWAQSFFPANDPRLGTGLLGQGSFLASRAGTVNPSPIKRGVFVREALMCQEFPPPAAANFNIVFEPTDSNRDATDRHTSNPACASCHQFINGVGFGFESYGSNAKYRTTELLGNGVTQAINALGTIKSVNSPETVLDPNSPGVSYTTVPELAKIIADSGQASACYSRQFYRYVMGRNETATDEPIIRAYSADVRAGGNMRKMLIDLTLADSFVLRRK